MDRYKTNKTLVENSPEINEAITRQISTNKIGKKVFTGENSVDGESYQQGVTIIEQYLTRDNRTQESVQGG